MGALYFGPSCASSSSHSGPAIRRHPAALFPGNFGCRCLPKDGRKLRLKLFDLFLDGNGLAELRGESEVDKLAEVYRKRLEEQAIK